MAKRKRVNPRRRPATAADVNRAKQEATDFAITGIWAIFFAALRDSEGFGPMRLQRVWKKAEYIADSIQKGYIKIDDLAQSLEEEDGIVLR